MENVLRIDYNKDNSFCTLIHPYNKRFIDFLKFNIKPQSYRRYNPESRKWSVHVSRLSLVVSFGKSQFSHVDYRSLPTEYQIKLVAEMKGGMPGIPKFEIDDTNPYAALFVLPGAPFEVVRAAYKALVSKYHPDHGGAQEDFLRIQSAYETLSSKYESKPS
jgi:hypothetical protein